MQSPSIVLLSNQQALRRAMDIVANNVANSSTTGFKREGIEFDSFLSQPAPNHTINFVVDRATYRDAATGPITKTDNPLDLAIQGEGYFQVQTPQGKRYTRNGSFQIDSQGQITNLAGQPLLSDGGQAITVPDTTTQINISGGGFVTARTDKGTALSQLGKIGVVSFKNEQKIIPEGNGLYSTSQVSAPSINSSVVQGALESSNVQPIVEMTEMIKIMRSYEQATMMVAKENERLTNAIDKLSRTTA
ncbi:MAG: flagellar basal-body rod protein FlgF [Alphaproteobacteria bacterium]